MSDRHGKPPQHAGDLLRLGALSLLLLMSASCSGEPESGPSSTIAATTSTVASTTTMATTTTAAPIQACLAGDSVGADGRALSESAWDGMERAEAELGVAVYRSQVETSGDYRSSIDAFIEQGCEFIVSVGYPMATGTSQTAALNPDRLFAIVDYPTYLSGFDFWVEPFTDASTNVRGLNFRTEQGAFVAGYVASGVSATGVIGTFGGAAIPAITEVMTAFVAGAAHYDELHGTATTVLGWNPDSRDGLFTGSLDSLDLSREAASLLIEGGADVIFPVAGSAGLGAGDAITEANSGGASVLMIGLDSDLFVSAPELADILLTSVVKGADAAVFDTLAGVVDAGGLPDLDYEGGFGNGGVRLAPYHELEERVPDELAEEVEDLIADIIAGRVATTD